MEANIFLGGRDAAVGRDNYQVKLTPLSKCIFEERPCLFAGLCSLIKCKIVIRNIKFRRSNYSYRSAGNSFILPPNLALQRSNYANSPEMHISICHTFIAAFKRFIHFPLAYLFLNPKIHIYRNRTILLLCTGCF